MMPYETFQSRDVRPDVLIQNGPYRLVAIEQSLNDPKRVRCIWWDGKGGVIKELLGKENDLFTLIYFDFDGTAVLSEKSGGFFDTDWAKLFNEAGIRGSVDQVSRLRWQVYQWERNVVTSTAEMLKRITNGVDIRGNRLPNSELGQLRNLFDQNTLGRWRALTQHHYQGKQPTIAEIIADRKEDLGEQLIRDNPKIVDQLAPLNPGFLAFLEALPKHIPVAIGSSSRAKTILWPILKAHDQLHPECHIIQRLGGLVFGEEDMHGHTKPDNMFFQALAINTAISHQRSGRIPPGMYYKVDDMLFIGDRGDIDIPRKRSMDYLIISPNDRTRTYGPMTAIVSDFASILDMKSTGMATNNSTLQRLVKTLL